VTSEAILQTLRSLADPALAAHHRRFFQTGEGRYGEGDLFLGIKVPVIRDVVKNTGSIDCAEVEKLLDSPYHEARFAGFIFLVCDFKKAKTGEARRRIFDFYIAHARKANNWDLVDCSCRDVVGAYLLNMPDRSILYRLAASDNLWEQRISIVSTWTFIKHGQYDDALALSEKLMNHPHDLMHKAIGWMLREAGKKDRTVLTGFLTKHYKTMPRTALRYAIEHYPPEERLQWLAR
jgi:3-methyladenine DNA glycosylase AlkD